MAHHFEQAGQKLAAARWHSRAAEWLTLRDASAALTHARRVRALLAGEDSDEAAALRLRACIRVLNEGWRVGLRDGEGEEVHREGLALAEAQADPGAASRIQRCGAPYAARAASWAPTGSSPPRPCGWQRRPTISRRWSWPAGSTQWRWSARATRRALTQTARLIALAPDPPHLGRRVLGFAPWILAFGSRADAFSLGPPARGRGVPRPRTGPGPPARRPHHPVPARLPGWPPTSRPGAKSGVSSSGCGRPWSWRTGWALPTRSPSLTMASAAHWLWRSGRRRPGSTWSGPSI